MINCQEIIVKIIKAKFEKPRDNLTQKQIQDLRDNEEELYFYCEEQKILPIVYILLDKYGIFNKITHLGKKKYLINKVNHFQKLSDLKVLYNSLGNLPHVTIKGVGFALIAFKDFGMRSSSDMDFIVDKAKLKEFKRILTNLGYTQGKYNIKTRVIKSFSREECLFYELNTHQAAPFVKLNEKGIPIYIDLNFKLTWAENQLEDIILDDFIQDSADLTINELQLKMLPLEKMLLQICLHHYREFNSIYLIYKGNSINLQRFCDIYFFIMNNYNKIRWDYFINISKKYNLGYFVYYVFYYTNFIFESKKLKLIISKLELEDFANRRSLNMFGLSEIERKKWSVDFSTRLNTTDQKKLIFDSLSSPDIKKIKTLENLGI